jgi:hypothetical protein
LSRSALFCPLAFFTAPKSCRTKILPGVLLAQFSGKVGVEVLFTSLTYKKNPGRTQAVGARGVLRPRRDTSFQFFHAKSLKNRGSSPICLAAGAAGNPA